MKKQKHNSGARWRATLPRGFYSRPEVHVQCGGYIQLEGCRRLTRLDAEGLQAEAAGWMILLYGKGLQIESLSGSRLLLKGELTRVEFVPTTGRKGGRL